MVSCKKGPTRHAYYTWQIGPFWQDTLKMQLIIRKIWRKKWLVLLEACHQHSSRPSTASSGSVDTTRITKKYLSIIYMYYIITLVRQKKSPVRQQNAWFDRKKPRSTEKCPVRQKNALPRMHQLTLPLSNILPPPPLRNIFFQFFSHIILRTNREMKIKLFWY